MLFSVDNCWSFYYNWDNPFFMMLMSKGTEKGLLSEIMSTKIITVGVDEYVEEALRLMVKFDVGSVIVMDKKKPVGIVTERDVTRTSLRGDSLLKLPVRSLMSKPRHLLQKYGGLLS